MIKMQIGDDLRHQFVRLSYSPEIMSMEFTREEMITIYDYIKDKEQETEALKYIIKDVYSSIYHELHGHILQHDEDSWNQEYYTNGKLDYRKLLIGLLSDYEQRLIKGVDK